MGISGSLFVVLTCFCGRLSSLTPVTVKVRWCVGGYSAYYACQTLIEEMRNDFSGAPTIAIGLDTPEGRVRYDAELVCVFAAHESCYTDQRNTCCGQWEIVNISDVIVSLQQTYCKSQRRRIPHFSIQYLSIIRSCSCPLWRRPSAVWRWFLHGCNRRSDVPFSFECADFIRTGKADVVRLTAEELYGLSTSDIYNSLVVAVAGLTDQHECTPFSDCHRYVREYSVAVIKRSSNIKGPDDLRDKRACFGNVAAAPGRWNTAGWIIPVSRLVAHWRTRQSRHNEKRDTSFPIMAGGKNETSLPQLTCPIDLNVAQDTFPASCAPGDWPSDSSFAPLFKDKLCRLCADSTAAGCSAQVRANEPFECLKAENGGDVAFVSSDEIDRGLRARPPTLAFHELATLCSGVNPLDRYRDCHWGIVPEDGYVVAKGRTELRDLEAERGIRVYGEFIRRLHMLAKANTYAVAARSFIADSSVIEISKVGNHSWPPTPLDYLRLEGGRGFVDAMNTTVAPTQCAKDQMRVCVQSDAEMQKCHEMQLAFAAAALPAPSLQCVLGYSKCVDMLRNGAADIAVVSAHRADDHIRSGHAKPLMKERYQDEVIRRPVAVAVTFGIPKISALKHIFSTNPERQLVGVCSAGTDSFAGWEAPNSVLKRLRLLPMEECRLTESWADRLRPSCVPGARSVEVTLGRNDGHPIDQGKVNQLCDGCGSTSVGTCKTPAETEDPSHALFDTYYGGKIAHLDIGALRCIRRKRGDIAFVRSTALQTLKLLKEANEPDFKFVDLNEIYLLCGDGQSYQKFTLGEFEKCNLGPIPERWMVARPDADLSQLSRWQDFWVLAQERARAHFDWLRTYIAFNETDRDSHFLDLIFSNSTWKLERFDLRDQGQQNWQTLTYDDKDFTDPFPSECRKTATGSVQSFNGYLFWFRMLVPLFCILFAT